MWTLRAHVMYTRGIVHAVPLGVPIFPHEPGDRAGSLSRGSPEGSLLPGKESVTLPQTLPPAPSP